MQYILSESEYKKLTEAKNAIDKIIIILKENYDEPNKTYNFNDETYRKIRNVLNWHCGSAYKVNILENIFQISKD